MPASSKSHFSTLEIIKTHEEKSKCTQQIIKNKAKRSALQHGVRYPGAADLLPPGGQRLYEAYGCFTVQYLHK